MGSAPARQRVQLQNQQQALQTKLNADSSAESNSLVQAKITAFQALQQMLETDHQNYQQSLHALSQAIHPFNLNTGESQFGLELPTMLQVPLQRLADLSQTYAPTASQAALHRWQRQIPDLSRTLHAWWQWVIQSLSTQTQDPEIQNWVLSVLLPWVYWHQQTQKTRQPQLKQGYQQAAQQAQARFLADGFTQTLHNSEQQQWIDWAIWMCAAYKPQMRERRGVYYTPEPVVSYIVRSVDHILKTDFKLSALARTLAMKALAVQTAKSGGAQHSLTNINC